MADIINLHPASENAQEALERSYLAALASATDTLTTAPSGAKPSFNIPDITGRLCDLFPMAAPIAERKDAIPMFSYSRPAWQLWQAVFEELVKAGWTEADAIAWLQSKHPRHMLDDKLTTLLQMLARWVARAADRRYIDE